MEQNAQADGSDSNVVVTHCRNQAEERPRTSEEIQAWLLTRLSVLMNVAPEQIDVREPFTAYGLSSMEAINLAGELEDWLDLQLSPTLVYDHPNIEALTDYLLCQICPSGSSANSPVQPREAKDQLDSLLSEIDQLSEVEAQALLTKRLSAKGL